MRMLVITFCVALLCAPISAHGGMDDESEKTDEKKSRSEGSIPRLLVLSVDGFRYDYVQMMKARREPLVNLERLIQEGVSAAMKPQFPTETFVNHVSMLTGLYPTAHGVLGNIFYDSEINQTFDAGRILLQWFDERLCSAYVFEQDGPEPLWFTNERQRSTLHPYRRSGNYLWPCAYRFRGEQPMAFESRFDDKISLRTRVDRVLSWFLGNDADDLPDRPRSAVATNTNIRVSTGPGEPINLAMVYYEHVDQAAHKYGPYSLQVIQALRNFDDGLGHLLEQVKELAPNVENLDAGSGHSARRTKRHKESASGTSSDWLNIVVVSDHGFAAVDSLNTSRTLSLSEILSVLKVNADSSSRHRTRSRNRVVPDTYSSRQQFSSHYHIDLLYESTKDVYEPTDADLEALNKFSDVLRVYRVGSDASDSYAVPSALRWMAPSYSPVRPRLRSLLFTVSTGYLLENDYREPSSDPLYGAHGYDPSDPSMRAIFVARGPAFRSNFQLPSDKPFENVHLYPLLCTVLQLRAAPSNGSIEAVKDLLADHIRTALNAPPIIEEPHSVAASDSGSSSSVLTLVTYAVFGGLILFVAGLIACGAFLRRNMRRTTAVRMHPAELIQDDDVSEKDVHNVAVRGKPTRKDVIRMRSMRVAERQKLMDDVDGDVDDDEVHT